MMARCNQLPDITVLSTCIFLLGIFLVGIHRCIIIVYRPGYITIINNYTRPIIV